jgi:hypothetical protein
MYNKKCKLKENLTDVVGLYITKRDYTYRNKTIGLKFNRIILYFAGVVFIF